jgi:hypothetical protein
MSGLVGFAVDKVVLVQVLAYYFCFPRKSSFQKTFNIRLSSGDGITGQFVAVVPKWTQSHPTPRINKKKSV